MTPRLQRLEFVRVCIALAALGMASRVDAQEATPPTNLTPRSPVAADPPQSAVDEAARAAQSLSRQQRYQLQYKFAPGDEIRWSVEHVSTTRIQSRGHNERSESRDRLVTLWRILEVDTDGVATIEPVVERAQMWSRLSDQEPVIFDSTRNSRPPQGYETIAETIGKPLVTMRIDPQGRVLERRSETRQSNLGLGDVTMPVPAEPIAVGHQWVVPDELVGREHDGRIIPIRIRTVYRLDSVADQRARIEFRTEVLTPISPKLRSQILQQLTRGWIVFDLANGRMQSKEVEWDEVVQGFEGADSLLSLLGRFYQRWMPPSAETASSTGPLRLRLRGETPNLRY